MYCQLVQNLSLAQQHTKPFVVTLVDGGKATSRSQCSKVQWEIQGYHFVFNLRTLDLGDWGVILGTDWMRHYSPITFDFQSFNIQMMQEGQQITLKGSVKDLIIQLVRGKEVPAMKVDQCSYAQITITSMGSSLQDQEVSLPPEISQ